METSKIRMIERTVRPGVRVVFICVILALAGGLSSAAAEEWRGLVVAPEYRCSPYSSRDYRYSQSLETRAVAAMGGRIYGPYTGSSFASPRQTDIEHIVARSEAHDSGLCAASISTRRQFAGDLLNITLASPQVNRCGRSGKCGKDAAEWMPAINRCWFAARSVEVRRRYRLTVDRREADALEHVLSGCDSTEMVFRAGAIQVPTTPAAPAGSEAGGALGLWDDDGNGRITCREAKRHGIAPVPRSHPAYRFMRDGDGDGVVCE